MTTQARIGHPRGGGTLRVVQGSGHDIHEDARAALLAVIQRMLVAAAGR